MKWISVNDAMPAHGVTASKEAGKQTKPISEKYWRDVVNAWKRVKELKGE